MNCKEITTKVSRNVVAAICCLSLGASAIAQIEVIEQEFNVDPQLPISRPTPMGQGMHNGQMNAFTAYVDDKTIRGVINKWSRQANWNFKDEHWSVARDFPVVADTAFNNDFKAAVRELLKTTELTDYPVQPCFYSNGVVRVVPYAELCDKTNGANQ